MSAFGYSFAALYRLEVEELKDLARLIKGNDHYLPANKEVLIRGVIIPFLRSGSRASKQATKDEVMRAALIKVAKSLKVQSDDWENADTAWIARQLKYQWAEAFRQKLRNLDPEKREAILKNAEADLQKRTKQMGLTFIPAAGIIAGEMSGFGIYLATTTGLGAISSALGVTFPWMIYQGSTTVLGITLGPIGWVLAGAGVAAGGAGVISQWFKKKNEKFRVVVVAIIEAIGENPYDWFGLPETANSKELRQTYHAMMKTFHPDKLEKNLPDWITYRFNELLLQTMENHDRIKRYQEEVG